MAHTYFGHQHATIVHHEDGKDHVHYQIGRAAQDDAPEQKNTAPKTEDQIPSTSFVENLVPLDCLVKATRYPQRTIDLYSVFLPVPLPPPWA